MFLLAFVALLPACTPPRTSTPYSFSTAKSEVIGRAHSARSTYFAIKRGDELIVRFGDSNKHEIASVTKSMCGIGLEMLRESGKIASFDTPLRQYFPEWARDKRGSITLREVMDQTSGLDATETSYHGESGDVVEQALGLKLVAKPGAGFVYNNVATNLLSGVIRRVSGMTPERLLRQSLFDGLGIREFFWQVDKHGNNPCYATLEMRGDDLLKVGEMLVGVRAAPRAFDARRLLARVRSEQVPGRPDYGLLWWKGHEVRVTVLDDATIEAWRRGRVPIRIVQRLFPMRGREFKSGYTAEIRDRLGAKDADAFVSYLESHDLPIGSRRVSGPVIWIMAQGSFGQDMILFPSGNAVVVRQSDDGPTPDPFTDLPELAQSLLSTSRGKTRSAPSP